ncbi:uncharacterized protein K02A2.6-like isoform X1 [Toxorhynchites rutilus septentrionalis]|uniref:uncharacterized protein K02A2.6-like isoform X1 n=1 Tax=Toxorhynchites rutilus septentrionalis TaxID=329112 RepID=UPI00247863E5|nr:uncharacterized protein K02A2.6-like isoform X1 [Toxorhynchites rutilus septentrionalis]
MRLLHVAVTINSCENQNNTQVFPRMPGIKIKFSIDKSIVPVKNAYYNVPAAFREGARNRLREIELRGIIERVTKAPEWISGMSAVAKGKNDFRLVVNMRGPNKAIKREYYRLPLIDEMKLKLHGARYFSKLDLSNAYYHLELCQESRDLTTFLTETGMFRFTRLMFAVNCAPEIFQREMVRILEGVKNVIVYIDDILLYATTLEELHKIVAQVLRIMKANSLTINTSKCEFDKDRIKFLGHELDKDGFHIEEAKVKSVQYFREPTTISELRSFLGLVSFVSPHIKNFADITSPLWTATTSWNWGPQQREAFNAVKERIIQCTIAQGFFSEDDRTILFTDASPVALGAVLAQENKDQTRRIISFASKALTTTEKKYLQKAVIQSLQTGKWPGSLRKFQALEGNLTTRDGIVVKTGCVVVPEQLREKALEVAHNGHPSTAKMKSILRQRVWWPGMATDAEKWVNACAICAINGRPERPTPMRRTFAPKTVWETIALDFNGPYIQFGGVSILTIVEYRSRYLIVKPVKSTSFDNVKPILEMVFEREGFPANIKTDNGPPFNGNEYKTYCSERGINTIYSTPLFPQQNGLVESYMKVINKAMSTASSNKTNFIEELRAAVDAHNAATHRVSKVAPEEIMTGRKIKRRLPLLRHESSNIDDELLQQRDRDAKLLAKQREDARRGARPCRIQPGDDVIVERSSRAKGETRFSPTRFTVVEEQNGSLTLTNDAGQIRRRHVSQTRKSIRGAKQTTRVHQEIEEVNS